MGEEKIRTSVAEVHRVVAAALVRAGCDGANADAVAAVVAAAERDGCASHGVFRLAGYLAALRSGKVDGAARPSVARIAPGVLRVDARSGFAPLAIGAAREALAPLAREQGLAAAAVVNAHHFSALWADVEPLAEAGLVAIAMTSYMPAVAPAGARVPFFGTNPMAFAWPRAGGTALVVDQASAAMARGEVTLAAREGRSLPPGTGIDAAGQPTTDPAAVLKGALLPFGGHKGSGIALMVELLAGALIGQSFSVEAAERDNKDGGPPSGGVFMLALDPARFGDAEGWLDHGESFLARLAALDGVRLPGDRRAANRRRIAIEGVELPAKLWAEALEAAA
ncbi:MAG: (2R)-3-sulfolactate dehydrogenase [Pseudomonadota bacterium]|jgi:delta1-piperideine-2-carboxylate reductase